MLWLVGDISILARLVDENGPKLTPDDEMDDKVAHSLDPFLSRLSRTNIKPPNFVPAFHTYDEYGPLDAHRHRPPVSVLRSNVDKEADEEASAARLS